MPTGIFTLKQQELALGQGAWTNQKPLSVDYLVVAGGGAGGGFYGAGGGAGGLLQGNLPVATGSALTVTVGGGGTGSSNSAGTNGSNSVFSAITATGGGFGPAGQAAGGSGGSGGGSGGNPAGRWGQGVFNQGNRGGDAGSGTGPAPGGGGGAGTRGSDGYGEGPAGYGGTGVASDISGTRTAYAGGGGGGTYLRGASGFNGIGGAGGGGAGGDSNGNNNGIAGTANTGGGGGGGSTGGGASSGGNGGSGIVILSYPDTYAAAASTTGSPTVSTSGSGSLAFNGSTQYLSYPDSSNYDVGSGDFTVECFFYPSGSQSTGVVLASQATNTYFTPWMFYFSATNALQFYSSSNGASFDVASGAVIGTYTPNAWNHAVICRSGTSIRCYLNGTLGSTTTTSATLLNATTPLYLAMRAPGVDPYFNGYISNFRLVKGSALYTASSITVPTAPLTPVTNTQLLVGAVSGSFLLDSSVNSATPTQYGSGPTWNQLSPFATGLGYKNRVYTWTSSGSITF